MPDRVERTFESRLLFINQIFADKYPAEDILSSCIQHKLKVSYESYLDELDLSIYQLKNTDPMKVLKKIEF